MPKNCTCRYETVNIVCEKHLKKHGKNGVGFPLQF